VNDINLRIRKEFVRMFVEKEKAHVQGTQKFIRTGDDVHLTTQLGEIHLSSFGKEITPNLL